MLKNQMQNYINKIREEQSSQVELYKEEKEYTEKNQLVETGATLVEKNAESRFADAYIERSDKETEDLIAEETSAFLNEPLEFLKKNKNEFVYLESGWFEIIGVDAVSLEVDDLFGTYQALLGLKLRKKFDKAIRDYLKAELQGDAAKFALLFNSEEGLWNLNFSVNDTNGFKEDMTIGETYRLIYHFLFKLIETVEEEESSI